MLLSSLVIGSTVESALYALVNEHYFLPTRQMPAMFYNKLEVPLFGFDNEREAWTRLNFMLGLLSKRIAFDDTSNIRVSEEEVRITAGITTFKYQFDRVYVFDTTNIKIENETLETREKTFVVIDDFELSTLGPKRYELPCITGQTGPARELHYYSSDRVDGASYITDCVVESELTQEQLSSFDYSDSMIRFVVERHLTSVGVHGIFMEYYNSGKPKYRKPKVTHVKRLVFERDNNVYKDTEKVKIVRKSLGEILEESTEG